MDFEVDVCISVSHTEPVILCELLFLLSSCIEK